MARRRREAHEFRGRILYGIESVASGSLVTLGKGNIFFITGTTAVNHILKTNWVNVARGTVVGEVVLILKGAITINHNAGSVPAGAAAIFLVGSAAYVGTDGDTLSLAYDSISGVWREIGRTVLAA